jgi:hypothetical protein
LLPTTIIIDEASYYLLRIWSFTDQLQVSSQSLEYLLHTGKY